MNGAFYDQDIQLDQNENGTKRMEHCSLRAGFIFLDIPYDPTKLQCTWLRYRHSNFTVGICSA